MFIKVTAQNGTRRLINNDKIVFVRELEKEGCEIICVGPVFPIVTKDVFEDIQNKIASSIEKVTPEFE